MTWIEKKFVDPVRFEITRQTGEVDLYEVLDQPLRGEHAGSIHRMLLKNGVEFIPPGMMTRDQFEEALKK